MNKMSLEEFRRIRNRIVEIFKMDVRELTPEEEEKLLNEYYTMLDELAAHDLSDIPFEEWRDVPLFKEGYLDFSKTHANLDFSIMADSGFEKVNLNGCNVRGLEYVRYEADTFDQEFKDAHPEYFPSKDLPKEIIDKYYICDLSFKDLVDYPSLKECIHANNFGGNTKRLIKLIGYDYALRMFEEYESLVLFITAKHDGFNDSFSFIKDIKFQGSTYEEAKETVFKTIIYNIEHYNIKIDDLIPEEMKKAHPEVYFDDSELPEEIVGKFRKGELSIWDLKNHYEALKGKNINMGIRSNYYLQQLVTLFGSIEKLLEDLPTDLYAAVMYYIDRHWWSEKEEIGQLFNDNREELYKRIIMEYINNTNNYFLKDVKGFSNYIPLERLIGDDQIVEFINFFGIDNIIEFSDKYDFIMEKTTYDYFSTNYDETFLGFLAKQNAIDYKTYSRDMNGLENLTKNLIEFGRNNDNSLFAPTVERLMAYGKSLSKISPNLFIDYELAEKLFKDVSSYNINSLYKNINDSLSGNFRKLFEVITEYPQAIQLYEGKKIAFEDYPELNEVVTIYGLTSLLDICLKYKEVFNYCLSTDRKNIEQMVEYLTKVENLEKGMNDFIYDFSGKVSGKICDYTDLPPSFKSEHPELFLPDTPDVPDDLKMAFIGMKIWGVYGLLTFRDLASHPNWIPFLDSVDLTRCIEKIFITPVDSNKFSVGFSKNYGYDIEKINILDFFCKYLPKRKVLEFLIKYANLLNDKEIIEFPVNELDGNNIEEVFSSVIYRKALTRSISLNENNVPQEFQNKYSDLFISKDAPEELRNLFYQKMINYDVLIDHPEWDKYIIDKNIYVCLDRNYCIFARKMQENKLSNKDILFLIRKYGRYLIDDRINAIKGENLQDIDEKIKNLMIEMIKNGFVYGEDAIPLVGELMPDYFLDADAPQELKDRYYYVNQKPLSFELMKEHRDWLPYLENKRVIHSLTRCGLNKYSLQDYFQKLGTRQGLIVGMRNPESVAYMLLHRNVDLLLEWVNRAKFVPHFIVMTTFPVEEIDKYMSAGKLWSQIMRIDGFNNSPENISALLKAAYCFGVFDGDMEGFTKFMKIFTDVPSILTPEEYKNMEDSIINEYYFEDEKADRTKKILEESYYLGEDGNYHARIDYLHNKEKAEIIRKFASIVGVKSFLSPNKAHQLFGGFEMKYDAGFRDFFMENYDEIMDPDNDYFSYMSAIHKAWSAIKVVNSNRVLTLQLAKDFVITNKYLGVEVGNDELAKSSSGVGYSQSDFDKLQEIYNYGKTRIHNSIPRIAGTFGRYNYEIMRLDDAYATAIGTMADCCQEIGNCAEVCMEHSMVSEHGRVFVIRDQEGNIEAQSWVWRNQNVLCFDNIEIPHKAFRRALDLGMSSEAYADEILGIYRKAAEEIIAMDEIKYRELLDAGRITQEQYDKLRIRKVTAGTGYNDIKESLLRNTKSDSGPLKKPLVFREPVKLSRSLYLHDSQEGQQILAGDEEVEQSTEDTLTVYTEEFRVVDKETMTEEILKMMEKIEFAARNEDYGNLTVYDKNRIIESIARNYQIDPNTTKIVIHPNFYIIYCLDNDRVVVADIVRNTKINQRVSERDITDIVNLQVGLALKQIKGDKEFDLSLLEPAELEIFNQALADEKMDSERGFSHGM